MISKEINDFIKYFSRLPAIGPRMATRLAFYIASLNKKDQEDLIASLSGLMALSKCENCFSFISKINGEKLCSICEDNNRDKSTIMIVERETDINSIEQIGIYKGVFILLGKLQTSDYLSDEQKNRILFLKQNLIPKNNAREIIIALAANTYGDFISGIIEQELKNIPVKITRLARGIPTGGEIEFADEETLRSAFLKRN